MHGGQGTPSRKGRLSFGWVGSSSSEAASVRRERNLDRKQPRACDMLTTDEERIQVMSLVKSGRMTIDEALAAVKETETQRQSVYGILNGLILTCCPCRCSSTH